VWCARTLPGASRQRPCGAQAVAVVARRPGDAGASERTDGCSASMSHQWPASRAAATKVPGPRQIRSGDVPIAGALGGVGIGLLT
jgi:hypothetical protein